jgi:hypothetical protein
MFKNLGRAFEKAGKQVTAAVREATDDDAVSGDNMKIVNNRDGKALQGFLANGSDVKLLTKEVAGYQGDSFLSFLFGKAIIEADLVVKGSKPLTHNDVVGSLYLLLYTAHHCAKHGEGGRVSFFLNKAIQDKGASQDTNNLLEQAIQASQYETITDSFAFSIDGFSINDSGILVPSASKGLGCKLGQSTCSWDNDAQETRDLDALKQQLELATSASYQQSAQDPAVQKHEPSEEDMQARVDALEAQVRTLSARLEEQGAASHLPPPYEEVRRDEEQQPLVGDVEIEAAT